MSRLHIHMAVAELATSIKFYSTIFNASPTVIREDYAKWDLSEPAVNFAISKRGHINGINHLGIQVDSEEALKDIAKRLDSAEIHFSKQEGSSCCYAHSNKHWTLDPQGIAWESFHTLEDIPVFGEDIKADSEGKSLACCIPLNMNALDDTGQAACCIPNEASTAGCCS